MNERKRFKNGFFMGRLIWVVGTEGSGRLQKTQEYLQKCQIQKKEMLVLNPQQLIDMFERGLSRTTVEQYEVLIVQDFENLGDEQALPFLKTIQTFRELQMGLAMRMVLVSDRVVPPALKNFEQFKAVQVSADDDSSEPEDLNARIHLLIEQATALSGVPIVRLTERAAVFLEYYSKSTHDRELLELILLGLHRSELGVLRFRDFLPDLFHASDNLSGAECKRN